MRRQDRKLNDSEAIEILQKGEYGILSMITTNNEGYGIPISYVLKGTNIYFHCATEGAKLDYIKNNSKVSFCVVGSSKVLPSKFGTLYESAIITGKIDEIDGDEKREGLVAILEKYSADYIKEGKEYIENSFDRVKVLRLTIGSISGKARKE